MRQIKDKKRVAEIVCILWAHYEKSSGLDFSTAAAEYADKKVTEDFVALGWTEAEIHEFIAKEI